MCLRISSRCASFGGWAEGKKMECNILYSLDLLNSWINGNVLKLTGKASLTWYACTLTHTHSHSHTHIHANTQLKDNMAIKTIDWCRQYQTGEFHFAVRITSICVKRLSKRKWGENEKKQQQQQHWCATNSHKTHQHTIHVSILHIGMP